MGLYAKFFCTAAVLTISLALFGQEQQHFADPALLARLSFNSGVPFQGSQICLAVNQDGSYRMIRINTGLRMIQTLNLDPAQRIVIIEDNGTNGTTRRLLDPTERFEGMVPPEQLQELQTLVRSSDLRPLAGNHVALIRHSAETFTAEIPIVDKQGRDGTLHLHVLNADGRSPFAAPVRKLVDWLDRFEPTNARRSADLEFQDVCPSVGFQWLQPSVATNAP
jgi:hypothetical protein